MAGAIIYLSLLRIQPNAAFSVDWTARMIFIVIIGGLGRIEGPIVGALVFIGLRETLADFGSLYLVILGVVAIGLTLLALPVGLEIGLHEVPAPWKEPPPISSILVILATDAPLLPHQCRRLAEHATIGLARAGGQGLHTSGDLFLAFATGNSIPARLKGTLPMTMLANQDLTPFFEAAADAVEESILNALCMAETMTGREGRVAHQLPLDRLQEIMRKYGRLGV